MAARNGSSTMFGMSQPDSPATWVLAEDKAGMLSQAIGLAEAAHRREGALAGVGFSLQLQGLASTDFATAEQNAAHTFWIDTQSVPLIPDPLYALQLLFLTVKSAQRFTQYSTAS